MGPPLEKFSYGTYITYRGEDDAFLRESPACMHRPNFSLSLSQLAGVSYVNANHSCIKARFARGSWLDRHCCSNIGGEEEKLWLRGMVQKRLPTWKALVAMQSDWIFNATVSHWNYFVSCSLHFLHFFALCNSWSIWDGIFRLDLIKRFDSAYFLA
jgi:hypothetical protein